MTARVRLVSEGHGVYELDEGLLLVFKPQGHSEARHAHAHGLRLRVLRGRLRVEIESRVVVLDPAGGALSLAAELEHATEALEATWLIAESVIPAQAGIHQEVAS